MPTTAITPNLQHPPTLRIQTDPVQPDLFASTIEVALTSLDAGHGALLRAQPQLTYDQREQLLARAILDGRAQLHLAGTVTTLTAHPAS